jgi:putative MATE family efflux protein
MDRTNNTKSALLIDGPVGKVLVKLTIPMIFGMVGIVAFNLVDAFFVGQLGAQELAALSFTFPVVMVIGSIALGLGAGASAVISRAIGEGDHERVKRLTTDSLVLSVLIVTAFVTLGFLTLDPLFRLLGATPELLPLIKQYMVIWYPGMVFLVVPMVGNNAIRATGDMKTPALIMILAAGVNAVLDPLLIFGPGPFPRLGLAGAATATVIARAISLIAAFWVLYYRDRMVTFAVPTFKAAANSWKSILYIALPTAGTRIIIPISIGVITRLMASYGPEAVAAFGVSIRIEFFAMTVLVALSSVMSPFVGQNWGAGRYDRVRLGTQYSKRFSMFWGAAMLLLLALSAKLIAPPFNDNPKIVSAIILYLMIVPIGFGFQGVLQISATTLNVLQKPFHAAALVGTQMFILYIPLVYAGSFMFGLRGAFAGIVLAHSLAGVIAHFVLTRILRSEIEKAKNADEKGTIRSPK